MQALQGAPVVADLLEGSGVWQSVPDAGLYMAFEGSDTIILDLYSLTFVRLKGTTRADMHKLSLAELSQLANGQERQYLSELSDRLRQHLLNVLLPATRAQ